MSRSLRSFAGRASEPRCIAPPTNRYDREQIVGRTWWLDRDHAVDHDLDRARGTRRDRDLSAAHRSSCTVTTPVSITRYHRAHILPAYPTTAVLESVGGMAAELVAAALLRARTPDQAVRPATLAGDRVRRSAVLGWLAARDARAAGDCGGHLVWLLFAAGWTFVMTVIAAIEAAIRRRRP